MNRRYLIVGSIVLAALIVAWWLRFGCDDAYITFHYSRNLVQGDGLTWFGERIEGYTNFAWALWIAGGIGLGIDPLVWSWVGSLVSLALVLVYTYRLVTLRATPVAGACALGLLATNFTFLAFGTSGLETMLQCALLTIATFEVARIQTGGPCSRGVLVRISLVAALALWTRLDSAVPLAVLGVALLRELVRQRAAAVSYVVAIVPAAVLVGGWLAWKLAYYGDLVPNTFHAKVALSSITVTAAARFVGAFLHSYMLWPVLLIVAAVAIVRRRVPAPLSLALVVASYAYIIVVGGDFMEFRFFVPLMPSLMTVISETVTLPSSQRPLPSPVLRAGAIVALLGAMSWRHAASFEGVDDRYYDSIQNLGTYYGLVRDGDWGKLGRPLYPVLHGTGATIACNGAGAIPYYADVPTIDQLGLNDAWVARHGARPAPTYARPGHQRFATYDYLVSRHVSFVIGSPTVVARGSLGQPQLPAVIPGWLGSLLGATPLEVPSLFIVAAPLDERSALLMWYLTPRPDITARIQAAGWEMRQLVRR